jgi:hypothetical protein
MPKALTVEVFRMRFCFVVIGALLITMGVMPLLSNPVYVHPRTRKAKRHKVPKHRSVQAGLAQLVDQQFRES